MADIGIIFFEGNTKLCFACATRRVVKEPEGVNIEPMVITTTAGVDICHDCSTQL